MKTASVFVVVFVLGALAGQARQPTTARNDDTEKIVRGCVIMGDGGYVLRDSNGYEWNFPPVLSPKAGDTGGAPRRKAPGAFLKPYFGYEIVVSGDAEKNRTLQSGRVQQVIGSCMAEPNLMFQPEGD